MALLPLLLAGSIAVTPPASVETVPVQQAAHPALWVIRDADTTIYLFGTFHALDGTTNWFKDDVKAAFDRSNELILETLVPELPKKNDAIALAPAKVSGQATARFAKRGRAVAGIPQVAPPPASLLASTQIVMNASNARGMSSSQGADAILRDAAENRGETVAGLESFQFQMNMFTSLPAPESPAPTADPETMQKISTALAQLQDAWNRGDITAFNPMLEQMRAQSPVSYDTMFVQRNAHWAHWIAERLQQPGVIFVAVGAGHLTGPDSVQNQLAAQGVKTQRIE